MALSSMLLHEKMRETRKQGRWETPEGKLDFPEAVATDVLTGRLDRDAALALLRDAGFASVTRERLDVAVKAMELKWRAAELPPDEIAAALRENPPPGGPVAGGAAFNDYGPTWKGGVKFNEFSSSVVSGRAKLLTDCSCGLKQH